MGSKTMDWSEESKEYTGINGDRRHDRRYGINLDLRWKVDLSSGGILFDPGRQLPVGLNVELAISWPVLLRNVAPMQLIVSGRIVRVSQNLTAVAMTQHEFRTAGVPAGERGAHGSAVRTPSALLGNTGTTSLGKYR
jgi:hypothetical protein